MTLEVEMSLVTPSGYLGSFGTGTSASYLGGWDRHEDVVDQEGWLKSFQAEPLETAQADVPAAMPGRSDKQDPVSGLWSGVNHTLQRLGRMVTGSLEGQSGEPSEMRLPGPNSTEPSTLTVPQDDVGLGIQDFTQLAWPSGKFEK